MERFHCFFGSLVDFFIVRMISRTRIRICMSQLAGSIRANVKHGSYLRFFISMWWGTMVYSYSQCIQNVLYVLKVDPPFPNATETEISFSISNFISGLKNDSFSWSRNRCWNERSSSLWIGDCNMNHSVCDELYKNKKKKCLYTVFKNLSLSKWRRKNVLRFIIIFILIWVSSTSNEPFLFGKSQKINNFSMCLCESK